MITPQDIQTKEFSHGVRGYKEDEVDIFLDELTADYDALIVENTKLKAQVEQLSVKLNEYREQEGAVVRTLEAAKGLMADISASAEKRADILLKNAEIDAASIVREAQEKLKGLKDEEAQVTARIANFKGRFKDLLESELRQFAVDSTPIVKKGVDDATVEQFNDIISSVSGKPENDFFSDAAFKNDDFGADHTTVITRQDD